MASRLRGVTLLRAAVLAQALAAVFLATGLPAAAAAKCAGRESDPDCVLYMLVRKCLDTSPADYCTTCPFPRAGYCPGVTACDKTSEVWTGTKLFAVLRDKTMCRCPAVMHGIVIPMGAVSGVEDVDRPPSIWKFSWDVSASLMPADQVALITNPPGFRTQNHLHVHIVPLEPSRMKALEAVPYVVVTDLYTVWAKAEALAASRTMQEYGVLIHQESEGRWHVHLENAPLTEAYTPLASCPKEQPEEKKKR